jgi:hypothetical protein
MEFLQLGEDCANRYLHHISAEIQRQSIFLDKLEARLEAAKKLREEAVDLQILYKSGLANIEDLRATGKASVSCRLQRQNADTLIFSTFPAASRGQRPVQQGGPSADRN